MNVLFLTILDNIDLNSRSIYNDLMRRFHNDGHSLYIVCTVERRENIKTYLIKDDNTKILHVRTFNLQKTNIIEKGIGLVSIEFLFIHAIKKYFKDIKFDLILYSTPPINFTRIIKRVKKINPEAVSYLLLKDIFPQNAVDMGLLKTTGLKGIIYYMFRKKEKQLYAFSDYIGCMSPANVKYVIDHNPYINSKKVEIAPNSIELRKSNFSPSSSILSQYGIPKEKPIFIYGGNIGLPQGIPFLIECLNANANRNDCHFVVVGSGTYYHKLEQWFKANKPKSVTLMQGLPKEEYDALVRCCQIGLIFLDYRFTIPNFPSRLLSYLEYKMPVICATDPNCDMGSIAENNKFGIYVPSNNVNAFTTAVDRMLNSDIKQMGENGFNFLINNYLVNNTYNTIIQHL